MEIIKFFKTGGPFMYPILIVLAFGVAIAIERYFFLSSAFRKTKNVWSQLTPMLKANDFQRAHQFTHKNKTPLAVVLNYGFARQRTKAKRELVESAFEAGIMEVMPDLEQRTHYLATFANVATLLGLLGTIIGLIQAFTAVASAEAAAKADLLSASISVAMNTTAFGLIVAIPLILTSSYLNNKTARLVEVLEMSAVKCLNIMDDASPQA